MVSEQQIRKTAGGDLGAMLKPFVMETYQVGMGRTALNVRGFMSAFNEDSYHWLMGLITWSPRFILRMVTPFPL